MFFSPERIYNCFWQGTRLEKDNYNLFSHWTNSTEQPWSGGFFCFVLFLVFTGILSVLEIPPLGTQLNLQVNIRILLFLQEPTSKDSKHLWLASDSLNKLLACFLSSHFWINRYLKGKAGVNMELISSRFLIYSHCLDASLVVNISCSHASYNGSQQENWSKPNYPLISKNCPQGDLFLFIFACKSIFCSQRPYFTMDKPIHPHSFILLILMHNWYC